MAKLLDTSLKHLAKLVSFDTQNPPRQISDEGIFAYIREVLQGFTITMTDHGDGAISLLAIRGKPRYLFNVHLDTVPVSPDWQHNPHQLEVTDEVAIGLGACDIKGAAASLLTAAQTTDGDMAMLFSSDEEANDTRCIKAFVKQYPAAAEGAFKAVIVAEPTQGKAVLAHRGILSGRVSFTGKAGHSSAKLKPGDSAVHQLLEWGHQALGYVEQQANQTFDTLSGLRFNIGRVEGGIKGNMVAPSADALVNMRPLPNMDNDALLEALRAKLLPGARLEETFCGSALPAGRADQAQARWRETHALANKLGFPIGNAVDFWTEAAKFSAAGYLAMVFGPGSIAQAHAADEWVALAELESHVEVITALVDKGAA